MRRLLWRAVVQEVLELVIRLIMLLWAKRVIEIGLKVQIN